MLWLALWFPRLPLNAIGPGNTPRAVVSAGRVVVADGAADNAGIVPGMRLSSALGLLPGLMVLERDPRREAEALTQLACWAGSLTPHVSVLPPAGLWLEVGACLRLQGGLEALLDKVFTGCEAQGFEVRLAGAPTPLGAWWLVCGGSRLVCDDPGRLREALAGVPVSACGWSAAVVNRLQGFGFHTLGQVFSQPRALLGQRLGAACLLDLARALGEMPDPRPWFEFPETFVQAISLHARVEEAEQLLFAARRLVAALCGWLASRGGGVSRLRLVFVHERGVESEMALGTAAPTRDEHRLLRLLKERLGRWALPAPVYGLRLQADHVVDLPGETRGLFQQGEARESPLACLERIQARLGEGRVFTPQVRAEFRPEMATVPMAPGTASPSTSVDVGSAATQPLWLLPHPRPLREVAGAPHWQGALQLLQGPERLESGWWDEGEPGGVGDVRRDYFMAATGQGQRVWIFRDAAGWFLQGFFA